MSESSYCSAGHGKRWKPFAAVNSKYAGAMPQLLRNPRPNPTHYSHSLRNRNLQIED